MVSKNKILIVDDDSNIAELISLYLAKECFDTQIVGDGESALRAVKTYQPDLILLDLMLPGIDGYQVCREVRASSDIPIIMLSAKGEVFDKVLGLELGADDYMEKPFDSKELVARAKAVLRRYKASAASIAPAEPDEKIVSYPDLTINLTNYSVTFKGSHIDMPPKELELFYFLASSPDAYLHANSFWIRSGAMSMSVIPVPSTSILNASVKKPATAQPGRSRRSGASVTNLSFYNKNV